MVRKGGITIYAALLLGVMMTLIITCMTSARMAAARAQIANSAEVGLFSLFGGYDRQLLEEYEIFGLNAGGSPSAADLAEVCRTVKSYMNKVLQQNSQHLVLQRMGLSGYRLLTDEGGESFYRQAVRYEKEKSDAGESAERLRELRDLAYKSDEYMEKAREEENTDWFSRYDAAMEEAYRLSREAEESAEEDLLTSGDEAELTDGGQVDYNTADNPIPVMHSIYDSGIFVFLTAGFVPSLEGGYASGTLLSKRTLLQGMEIYDGFQKDDSDEAGLLFQCYIHDKMGNVLKMSSGFPSYQMEYILEGSDSDRENLEGAVEKIFLMRFGICLETVKENEDYGLQIDELAGRICSVFTVPPDIEVIRSTIAFCWAYGESLCEVHRLLSGGTVPFSGSEFTVPLSGLYIFPEYLENGDAPETGENGSYEDYLSIFMLRQQKSEKLVRTMDVVESSIRTSGRAGFYLDHCLADAEISADVRANGRKTFTVTKSYGYD